MKKMTLDEIKKVELGILKNLVAYLEENNLRYIIDYGTLLGAIRHGGFIPWDDDMDLNMSRKDYDYFAKEFEKSMGDKYELFVPDGKHKITHLFMKVSKKGTVQEEIYTAGCNVKTGIAIDIFPIENVPEQFMLRKMKGLLSNIFAYTAVSIYMFQNNSSYLKNAYKGTWKGRINYVLRNILGALFSFRSYEKWYLDFDKFAQTKAEGTYCTVPTGRKHYNGELQNRNVFFPTKETVFEGVKAYVPCQEEKYLTALYGDYMKLPPEDKREKHFYTQIEF